MGNRAGPGGLRLTVQTLGAGRKPPKDKRRGTKGKGGKGGKNNTGIEQITFG